MECLICERKIDEGEEVLVERGLKTLIQASVERGDDKHKSFEKLKSVPVHKLCRKNYTRKDSIAAVKKSLSQPSTSQTCAVLRSSGKSFDFRNDCIFCGEKASAPDAKYPKNRRLTVNNVATLEFRDKIISICEQRSDQWGQKVYSRIANTIDLVAEEGRYHFSCYTSFKNIPKRESAGRPEDSIALSAFKKLVEYIDSNDECQYSLSELKKIMAEVSGTNQEDLYSDHWLKTKLLAHYKDSIYCTHLHSQHNIFTFTQTGQKILTEQWYADKKTDETSERLRIVETAAKIIREDICRMAYDCKMYPNTEDMKTGGRNLVPASLKAFSNIIITSRTDLSSDTTNRKRTFINQSIIAATRPRSFISPLQLGLSVHLHRCYGSRHLIDMLHVMGVCSSYKEATTYLNCVVSSPQSTIEPGAFTQFVFDNADVNIKTLDGLGTFHALGGIKCVTPSVSVSQCPPVERKVGTKCDATSNQISIKPYKKPHISGLKNIIMRDITYEDEEVIRKGFNIDILWMIGFSEIENKIPIWNGFMKSAVKNGTWDVSHVLPIPFINLPPGNMTTLYSALTFAANQSKTRNQTCIVTFDQPLFLKSVDIVTSEPSDSLVSSVVVRLGGFHLLMSFMGAIGNIMSGSGIEELWQTVYGKATVGHMMKGHAYARAMRAHILTAAALFYLIHVELTSLSEVGQDSLRKLCKAYLNNEATYDDVECISLNNYIDLFEKFKQDLETSGRTPKLWLQYFQQVLLILQFIRAERTGNWKLHIAVVKKMMPYFHSAGHLHYAKCAHLYLHLMEDLHNKMSALDFKRFTRDGYFAIRRSDRFWSGVSTDMCIEQILMRNFKAIGGLTHGRGITDSTLQRWVSSASIGFEISEALSEFTGVNVKNILQSTESGKSRISRDNDDLSKFINWLKEHSPFRQLSGQLVNISNGLIADQTITCDRALEIGKETISSLSGSNFSDVHLQRKRKVVPLSKLTSGTIKMQDKHVILSFQQELFHRMLCLDASKTDIKEYFEYELASVPPSLFDSSQLRKGTKSSFLNAFCSQKETLLLPSKPYYVLDGGNLLHSVPWPKPATFGQILDLYVSYVETHYGKRCSVVFDGYPERDTTKTVEQERRTAKRTSRSIIFDEITPATIPQSDFLANRRNKSALIDAVMDKMKNRGYSVLQAESDADTVIINVALDHAEKKYPTVVVGQDTDLLVLLTALANKDLDIWYLKPGKSGSTHKLYNIQTEKTHMGESCDILLFVYAMTGSDTTSALYKKGKVRALRLLQNNQVLRDQVKIFNQKDASRNAIKDAGEKFILKWYGSKSKSLNELRYFMYNRIIAKKKLSTSFQLASLPPTSAAAEQHSYRVYLQVQEWLGNCLDPTKWGWSMIEKSLKPIPTTKEVAPLKLLNLISCNCKVACNKRCKCAQFGMHCSAMCGECQGTNCENSVEIILEEPEY